MTPDHVNPMQWQHAVSVARQSCARVFRDGGTPADALDAFGLAGGDHATRDWSRAVEEIASSLCAAVPMNRAA